MPNKGLLLFALLVLLAVLSVRALVRVIEQRNLFHPDPVLELSPAIYGIEFMDVVIRSGGYNLHGWFMRGQPSKRYVIFYHGNAGNIADRLDFIRFMAPAGLSILIVDYRGYGRSEGRPTVKGIEEDAAATLDWLHAKGKVPMDRIVLWGRSLGVSAALAAAKRRPGVAGVILESGWVSLRRIAGELFPFVPTAFVTDGFDNGAIVSALPTPKLIIHGMEDGLIPFHHAEELIARAAKPKTFMPIKTAGHNDTYIRGGDEYRRVVGGWIAGL